MLVLCGGVVGGIVFYPPWHLVLWFLLRRGRRWKNAGVRRPVEFDEDDGLTCIYQTRRITTIRPFNDSYCIPVRTAISLVRFFRFSSALRLPGMVDFTTEHQMLVPWAPQPVHDIRRPTFDGGPSV